MTEEPEKEVNIAHSCANCAHLCEFAADGTLICALLSKKDAILVIEDVNKENQCKAFTPYMEDGVFDSIEFDDEIDFDKEIDGIVDADDMDDISDISDLFGGE